MCRFVHAIPAAGEPGAAVVGPAVAAVPHAATHGGHVVAVAGGHHGGAGQENLAGREQQGTSPIKKCCLVLEKK